MKKRAVRRTTMVSAMEESKGGLCNWDSFLEDEGGDDDDDDDEEEESLVAAVAVEAGES